MHALLVERADALISCSKSSPEEAELAALTDTIEGYEWQKVAAWKNPGRQRIVSVISRGAKDKARREGKLCLPDVGQ